MAHTEERFDPEFAAYTSMSPRETYSPRELQMKFKAEGFKDEDINAYLESIAEKDPTSESQPAPPTAVLTAVAADAGESGAALQAPAPHGTTMLTASSLPGYVHDD